MLSNIKESKENTRLGILFRLGESTDFNISKNKRRILSNLYQHIAKYVLEKQGNLDYSTEKQTHQFRHSTYWDNSQVQPA